MYDDDTCYPAQVWVCLGNPSCYVDGFCIYSIENEPATTRHEPTRRPVLLFIVTDGGRGTPGNKTEKQRVGGAEGHPQSILWQIHTYPERIGGTIVSLPELFSDAWLVEKKEK